MKKLLLKIEGAQKLTKEQMKSIGGAGEHLCGCPITLECVYGDGYFAGFLDLPDTGCDEQSDSDCDATWHGSFIKTCWCNAC